MHLNQHVKTWPYVVLLLVGCVKVESWFSHTNITSVLKNTFHFPFSFHLPQASKSIFLSMFFWWVPFTLSWFMVDYTAIRLESPSVSFFFARLGVFLKYSSGWHPQVGLFMPHDCALRLVLLELYPWSFIL